MGWSNSICIDLVYSEIFVIEYQISIIHWEFIKILCFLLPFGLLIRHLICFCEQKFIIFLCKSFYSVNIVTDVFNYVYPKENLTHYQFNDDIIHCPLTLCSSWFCNLSHIIKQSISCKYNSFLKIMQRLYWIKNFLIIANLYLVFYQLIPFIFQ